MHKSKHHENHKQSSEKIRDLIIGMADGLTVPFALAAGLSGAEITTKIIVTAGVAEIAAGSIAMALGGYLAAQSDKEHYEAEYEREQHEVEKFPDIEEREVEEILRSFGVSEKELPVVLKGVTSNKKRWVDFMMRFELGLVKPKKGRVWISPLIIGLAYIFGGLVPLSPYIMYDTIDQALKLSCYLTGAALLIFGYSKGVLTGANKLKSSLMTFMVGGLAATTAYFVAKYFGGA